MPAQAHKLPITAAEYLEGELLSETRHEFVDGRCRAAGRILSEQPVPGRRQAPWYHLNRIED